MNSLTEYRKCTNLSVVKGRTIIACKLGLWSVDSLCHSRAHHEAQHYFLQYKSDGEYSGIIGGPNVAEVLIANKKAANK